MALTTVRSLRRDHTALAVVRDLIVPTVAPACRAFLLSYAAAVVPHVLNVVVGAVQNRRQNLHTLYCKLRHILLSALSTSEISFFWGALLGSSVTLSRLARLLLCRLTASAKYDASATFLSAMLASGFVFRLRSSTLRKLAASSTQSADPEHVHEPSRTMDSTLFVVTAALDYGFRRFLRLRLAISPARATALEGRADVLAFVASVSVVMYAWFYHPLRLPKSYNHWITKFADFDTQLLELLRLAQQGKFIYGKDTGCSHILADSCIRMGLPAEYGDPAISIPLPCVVVHQNSTKNCELHALWRFSKAFKSAFSIYLPLNLLLFLRRKFRQRPVSARDIIGVLRSSAASASFLGAFVALSWYPVCLTRTRLGPSLFPSVNRTRWDNTLGPAFGCFLCGWSILLESTRRRGELALFVMPRAVGVFLPRVQTRTLELAERAMFAVAFAAMFSAITSPRRFATTIPLRGMFGNALETVMGSSLYA
ncbi:uncharacterized protein V1518DRAFT_415516 [Limtongia smithiae]|uniref:uncharacterized protein n=1 Tax=Limtongia smithiae TaxID=1125753 RepID=UPI0034CD982C